MINSKVCITTKLTLASLLYKGLATKQTAILFLFLFYFFSYFVFVFVSVFALFFPKCSEVSKTYLTIHCHVSDTGLYQASRARGKARVAALVFLGHMINGEIAMIIPVGDKTTVLHPAVLGLSVTLR